MGGGLARWLLRAALMALTPGGVAAGLAAGLVPPEAVAEGRQVSMTVQPAEARAMAARALQMGRAGLAATIAKQILSQHPGDAEARVILASAQAQTGQVARASAEARRAFGQSRNADLRFQAAYLTASTLAAQGKLAGAKLWLRRADGLVQSPGDSLALARAFQGVDRRMPLRWSVTFSGGPSDNVNGGSLHDTFWVWGLPIPIAQALPGHTVQGQIKAEWRLGETATSQVMAKAALSTRQVHLGAGARALNPAARASDYESLGLDLGLGYRWRVSDVQGYGLEVMAGHRWLAAGRSSDSLRLKFSADRALSGGRFLSLGVSAIGSRNSYSVTRDQLALGAEAALSLPVAGGSVTGTLGYDAVVSQAPGVAWRGPKLAVEWAAPALPGDIRLSLFGEMQAKDFWKTGGDPDLSTTLGASARFDKLSVMGFAPTLSVTSARSRSDIVVRDTAETAVSLGLTSKF